MKRAVLLISVACVVLGFGCHRAPVDQQVYETMAKARTMAESGQTDGAVQMLEAAMGKSALRQYKPVFLQEILVTLLITGRVDSAEAKLYQAAQQDPEVAGACLRPVASYFFQEQQPEKMLGWCTHLASLKLPDRPLLELADIHLTALRMTGATNEVMKLLPAYLSRLAPASQTRLADSVGHGFLADGRVEAVSELLDFIDKNYAGKPDWRLLSLRLRMDLLLAEGMWEDADKHLRQSVGELGDGDFGDLLNRFLNSVIGAQQTELADKICSYVLTEVQGKPNSKVSAAQAWVNAPLRAGNLPLVVHRLSALTALQIPQATVIHLAENAYGAVMEKGTDEDARSFAQVCDSLITDATSAAGKTSLKGMILDADFRCENFDHALTLLEAGIPGQNPSWHDVMINKVKAHKALKEGRKQEAVDRFRKFMDHIAAQASDQIDPVTGLHYTREMILGLNWTRVGGILASMGEKNEAADAYKKAREFYQTAAAKMGKDSDEYKQIQEDLKKIP